MKLKNDEFKLDNSSLVYPAAKTKKWSAMFKMSATLKEDIDVDILKEALKVTLNRLPCFKTTLKNGPFWHYFKQIEGLPVIEKDVTHPMETLNIKANNGFLFRVRYDKNKLSFEYFHALTDGFGGLTFMLTTIKEYLSIKYNKEFSCGKYLLDCNETFKSKEYADDYYFYSKTTL